MKTNEEKKIRSLLAEISVIARELPSGKSRQISNRCDKITMVIKKSNRRTNGKS